MTSDPPTAARTAASLISDHVDDKVILLVEDDPRDEELTLRALRRSKIPNPVIVARDGAEAVDYVLGRGRHADRPVLPQLVLLDLKLPKLDGLEVLRQVRAEERTRYLPIVILASSKEDLQLELGYRLGANSYVHKPVDFDAFALAVGHLGHYWLRMNELSPSIRGGP